MTLELVVGPVRSGKLGVLLGRFADRLWAGARPLLLVPAAFERDALERDACAARAPCWAARSSRSTR